MSLALLTGLLLALSPFTALGIWDRRRKIAAKVNEWTKPKKAPEAKPKEPTP